MDGTQSFRLLLVSVVIPASCIGERASNKKLTTSSGDSSADDSLALPYPDTPATKAGALTIPNGLAGNGRSRGFELPRELIRRHQYIDVSTSTTV